MLLLMRRVGEAIRIREDIILEIKEIQEDMVIFNIQGLKEIKTEEKNPQSQKEVEV